LDTGRDRLLTYDPSIDNVVATEAGTRERDSPTRLARCEGLPLIGISTSWTRRAACFVSCGWWSVRASAQRLTRWRNRPRVLRAPTPCRASPTNSGRPTTAGISPPRSRPRRPIAVCRCPGRSGHRPSEWKTFERSSPATRTNRSTHGNPRAKNVSCFPRSGKSDQVRDERGLVVGIHYTLEDGEMEAKRIPW